MHPRHFASAVLLFAIATMGGRLSAQEIAAATTEAGEAGTKILGVVELFTSQGCSACPPADSLLKRYAERPGIVALTLPVDYWDYLGWKDTLATPRNAARQRNYARTRGDGAVYTPQVVINGSVHVHGARDHDIERALESTRPTLAANQVPIHFSMHGNTVMVQTGSSAAGSPHTEATVWLAMIQRTANVRIQRGENIGKTVTYTNVVRELAPLGMWTGKPMQIRLTRASLQRPETQACAILMQAGDGGPIIGAAWITF
jgi:hypothetical protein